jgi:hypothetical protein
MWFILALITMICIESFNWQHTRRCDWETFEGREEFFEQVRRKGDKLGKMMMYKRKQEMHEKYLNVPHSWILGTIKRELNASGGDTSEDRQDHHEMALAYWRQNRRQYPPTWLWDIFYYDLLFKSFESRYELRDWCTVRLQQLNDPVYYEEQWLKAKEEKRLAQEAEEKVRRETPGTWEHQKVVQEEANRRAREADDGGMTYETWPPPQSPSGISLRLSIEILQFIAIVV